MRYRLEITRYRNSMLRVFALVAVTFALGGCVHIAKWLGLVPEKPKIEFAAIRIKNMSFTSVDLEVSIDITNRDKRALEIHKLDFELKFDSHSIGHGQLSETVKIEATQKSRTKIPITLKISDAAHATAQILNGGQIENFRIIGSAQVESAIGSIEVPFDHPIIK